MIYIKEAKSRKMPGEYSLFISFSFNQEIVNIIKQECDIYDYDKKTRIWEIPELFLSNLLNELVYIDSIDISLLEDEEINKDPKLVVDYPTKPFPYQIDGIKYGLTHDNWLLLDPPGLGKTLQMIYLAEELKAQRGIEHCLIICGINTLKTNWKKEIQKHSNLDCVIIGERINSKGKVNYTSMNDRANQLVNKIDEFFIILNIESIRSSLIVDAIRNSVNNFDMMVFDEVHCAKSATSDQGKNLLKLRNIGKYHIGLTGTIMLNSPIDCYVPLKFIGKENSNLTNFKKCYCVYDQRFRYSVVGYKNADLLKKQIERNSLRRSKDLLHLPPKLIVKQTVDMNDAQAKLYDDIKQNVLEDIDRVNISTKSLLGKIVRLRQASTCPSVLTSKNIESSKVEYACELVDKICSDNEKVILFSVFKEPLDILKKKLEKYNPVLCTGDIADLEVSKNIDKFQNDPECKVFLGTISKCGTGITLTAASYEIFLDSSWTEGVETQAEDRAWRVGTNKTVIIYKLVCANTIDEHVQEILENKKILSDYVVDNKITELDKLKYLLEME